MLKYITGLLVLALVLGGGFPAPAAADSTLRRITDRTGRTVQIPDQPRRVACLFGPSYEKLLALGAADRVVMVPNLALPWCRVVNPALDSIPVMDNFNAPEVETLLKLKTDLVIYHPFAKQIQTMTAAGLPVAVAYDGRRRLRSLDAFIRDWYDQILFYGDLLGGQARERARAYCDWAGKRIRHVVSLTAPIPPEKRPRVFWFCGQANGPAGTQTRNATADWLVTAAGGTLLTHDESAYFISVSAEEMILWDPDIILVSTLPSVAPVTGNPHWRNLKAVREGRVYMTPEGQFYWSHFSTESFLCILYLAKLFHPDLFAHTDLTRELKSYYARFYHFELTDDQARRILAHLPPGDGTARGD